MDEREFPMASGACQPARSPGGEFHGNLLLLASAAIGLSISMNAAMIYSLGSFIGPLEGEFGWARGDISLAATALTCGLFLAGPMVGLACDRFGAAVTGASSLVGFAMVLLTIAATLDSLRELWLLYFLCALAGAGSTPIVLLRPVSAAFDRQRGLALGIALTGAGLTAFWIPNVITALVANSGWRGAYAGLALIALLIAPVVFLGFRSSERRVHLRVGSTARMGGSSIRQARRSAAFWWMSAMAVAMALGIGGVVVHLVPMFLDLGMTPATAAGTASVMGIASVAGRLAVGFCLDRFPPHRVAMAVLVLGILGLFILQAGAGYAVAGVVLIGLLLGAELDMLAFLTTRLFGHLAFGAIYGWFYSIFALGFGIGPFLIGRLRDASGSYGPATGISVVVLLLAVGSAWAIGQQLDRERERNSGPV